MTKLYLSEFVRYNEFEDVFFEGIYDDPWGKETAKWDAAHGKTGPSSSESLPLLPYNPEPVAQQAQPVQPLAPGQPIALDRPATPLPPIEQALVDFIANQLPNVRLDPNRLSLEDMVLKNGGNLATTLAKPEMAEFFRMLGMNVRSWLGQLKGETQQQASDLLKPFGGNVSQLVKAIAPNVSAKLQQTKHNELK